MTLRLLAVSLATTLAGCSPGGKLQAPAPASGGAIQAESPSSQRAKASPGRRTTSVDVPSSEVSSNRATKTLALYVNPARPGVGQPAPDLSVSSATQARCLKDAIGYAQIEDALSGCLVDAGYESDTELQVEMDVEVSFKTVRIRDKWDKAPSALQLCVQGVLDGARNELYAHCSSTHAELVLHWNAKGIVGPRDGYRR